MSGPLPYRTAVVTGATSGIGKAVVSALRARGLTVHAVGRNRQALDDLAGETGVIAIEADVRDTAAIERALSGVEVDISWSTMPGFCPPAHIGSSGGQAPYPDMSVYGASKTGLSLFCDNLRCDPLGSSVRVSEIVPGRVQTALYRTSIPYFLLMMVLLVLITLLPQIVLFLPTLMN